MTDTAAPPRGAWRRAPLRNTLGEVVEVVDDDQGAPRATAPGRLVVVSGQTIASAWGNTTYDQTTQVFATAADRANQWPAPNDGAMSYLADTGTPWQYRAGAWHGVPMGYIASGTGPAATTDCPAAGAVVASINPVLVAGRRYRISVEGYGTQILAVGNSTMRLVFGVGYTYLTYTAAAPVSSLVMCNGLVVWLASANGPTPFSANGLATAGAMRIQANVIVMTCEDIGS